MLGTLIPAISVMANITTVDATCAGTSTGHYATGTEVMFPLSLVAVLEDAGAGTGARAGGGAFCSEADRGVTELVSTATGAGARAGARGGGSGGGGAVAAVMDCGGRGGGDTSTCGETGGELAAAVLVVVG